MMMKTNPIVQRQSLHQKERVVRPFQQQGRPSRRCWSVVLALVTTGLLMLVLTGWVAGAFAGKQEYKIEGSRWKATSTFLSGPKKSQKQAMELTFQKEGRLLVTIGERTIEGSWWQDRETWIYTFLEPLQPGLMVAVTHRLERPHHETFTSQGYGTVYSTSGQHVLRSMMVSTETTASLLPMKGER